MKNPEHSNRIWSTHSKSRIWISSLGRTECVWANTPALLYLPISKQVYWSTMTRVSGELWSAFGGGSCPRPGSYKCCPALKSGTEAGAEHCPFSGWRWWPGLTLFIAGLVRSARHCTFVRVLQVPKAWGVVVMLNPPPSFPPSHPPHSYPQLPPTHSRVKAAGAG